ncbi:MAG: SMC-Scp complex subunit ScpB [Ruminococcaceae bacterium]|nr:SMC-Scp complex subunit ScpB [Oscillospiraceae bacterium]
MDITAPLPVGEAPEGLDAAGIREAFEAILFAAGHPMSYEKLALALGITEEEAAACADELSASYEGRGIQLIRVGDGCQLVTREKYLPYIRTALGVRRGGNLSRASLETLAIIAYNQPVTRSYIDEVRGVDTGYVVSSLVEKGLIASKGRLDVPGRPTLYGTTDAFLRVFGLEHLGQLPPAEQFLSRGETEGAENPDAVAQLHADGD